MKIGFFDSGLGGLIILRSTRKRMSEYDYMAYFDTANLPYGDKSEPEVCALTVKGIANLYENGCVLVVLACNSASVRTLRYLQDTWLNNTYPDRKLLGVVIPTVETVVESGMKKVMLLATERTISSNKYTMEIMKRDNTVSLDMVATPWLVPMLEKGEVSEAVESLKNILERHIENNGEGVILGCTHYSLLSSRLRLLYKGKLSFFSQDEIIPNKLENYFTRHPEIENRLSRGGTLIENHTGYVTTLPKQGGGYEAGV